MELDQFIPGNILFADGNSIKTTDGTHTDIVVGSSQTSGYIEGIEAKARFNMITGFSQVTNSAVVVADYKNHCLRLVNRKSYKTSVYAGKCTEAGYKDGDSALFYRPASIIVDMMRQLQTLIVCDRYNNALRLVDVVTREVGTFMRSDETLYHPIGLTQDFSSGDLFITTHHAVYKLAYENKSLKLVAGSKSQGYRDGYLRAALFSYPRELMIIHGNKFLVADQDNNRLRVIDVNMNRISSICSGTEANTHGDFSSCELNQPRSLLISGSTLFVGGYYRIRRIRGEITY